MLASTRPHMTVTDESDDNTAREVTYSIKLIFAPLGIEYSGLVAVVEQVARGNKPVAASGGKSVRSDKRGLRLRWAPHAIVPGPASHQYPTTPVQRMKAVNCEASEAVSTGTPWPTKGATPRDYSPAWETDSPASSISWSMENPHVPMSSWSRAAAAFAPSVWPSVSGPARRANGR